MERLTPIPPGELLDEEFLQSLGVSQYRLARAIDVFASRISEIVTGHRAISADTDLRLCPFLGLSPGNWLRAQAAHDIELEGGGSSGCNGETRGGPTEPR
jgi:addiction module HigA family antidote